MAVSRETPESTLLTKASQRQVQAALVERVPVSFREMLLLCEVEEMSYQEIADTLAVPIGTVMLRLGRARKALRSALEKKMPEAKLA